MVSTYLMTSSNSPDLIESVVGQQSPVVHVFVLYILPELIAFGCTAFVLHAGRYFEDAKHVGVIARGEHNWKETLDEQLVLDIGDKHKARTDVKRQIDKDDPDRELH